MALIDRPPPKERWLTPGNHPTQVWLCYRGVTEGVGNSVCWQQLFKTAALQDSSIACPTRFLYFTIYQVLSYRVGAKYTKNPQFIKLQTSGSAAIPPPLQWIPGRKWIELFGEVCYPGSFPCAFGYKGKLQQQTLMLNLMETPWLMETHWHGSSLTFS